MNHELESKIEARVLRWAKANGWRQRKLNGLGDRAWPDRMFLFRYGVIAFVEFKRQGEVPTPQQAESLRDLRARGFNADYFDDSDKAIRYLETLGAGAIPKARRQVPNHQ